MLPYGLVGMGDGGVDNVRMSTHFKSFTFWLMCGKSSTCGPLMTTPSRFCRFRRRDLIDSTRRNNALAPSFRRSLPVRRNRTGWSWSLCDCENPSGSVENPRCSSLKSLCSGLDSRDVSKVLGNFSVGFSISISPTRDQRRFFCWNVQFSLNAYSSSSESSLFCCCTSGREREMKLNSIKYLRCNQYGCTMRPFLVQHLLNAIQTVSKFETHYMRIIINYRTKKVPASDCVDGNERDPFAHELRLDSGFGLCKWDNCVHICTECGTIVHVMHSTPCTYALPHVTCKCLRRNQLSKQFPQFHPKRKLLTQTHSYFKWNIFSVIAGWKDSPVMQWNLCWCA